MESINEHPKGRASPTSGAAASATSTEPTPHWTDDAIRALYDLPFPELMFRAQTVHRQFHDPTQVQMCTLMSIKTGGCPEDCSYCPQSVRYQTEVDAEALIDVDDVLAAARAAHDAGSTRFCMGAAWRKVRDNKEFDNVLAMVRGVTALGMEACCTLVVLTIDPAKRLADAGLTAYNHNLDTGPDYYDKVITTRTYQDRLDTLQNVRDAGITVCSGGILGMGESLDDRIAMLGVLASLDPQPESVPINALVPVAGTPLATQPTVSGIEMARMIATARIVLPRTTVRLSAGRTAMSIETQTLCFLAGANSIFTGERLLTTPNPGEDHDRTMLETLGLSPRPQDAGAPTAAEPRASEPCSATPSHGALPVLAVSE